MCNPDYARFYHRIIHFEDQRPTAFECGVNNQPSTVVPSGDMAKVLLYAAILLIIKELPVALGNIQCELQAETGQQEAGIVVLCRAFLPQTSH